MLRTEDEASFRQAVKEFERETPPWQFAFDFSASGIFGDYVQQLKDHARGVGIPEHFVPNTFLVGVVDGVIVGRLSLRHSLNAALERVGGHIGYGVVASQRRRGYAKEMLRQAIPLCRALGLDRVLLTCDEDNLGSRKVIEGSGGIFEGSVDDPPHASKRRYWISVTEPATALSAPQS